MSPNKFPPVSRITTTNVPRITTSSESGASTTTQMPMQGPHSVRTKVLSRAPSAGRVAKLTPRDIMANEQALLAVRVDRESANWLLTHESPLAQVFHGVALAQFDSKDLKAHEDVSERWATIPFEGAQYTARVRLIPKEGAGMQIESVGIFDHQATQVELMWAQDGRQLEPRPVVDGSSVSRVGQNANDELTIDPTSVGWMLNPSNPLLFDFPGRGLSDLKLCDSQPFKNQFAATSSFESADERFDALALLTPGSDGKLEFSAVTFSKSNGQDDDRPTATFRAPESDSGLPSTAGPDRT